jgi:hypothetical protein
MRAMNVWALDKDIGLKQVLLRLQDHLGAEEFRIEGSDETHACAVFLCHRSEPELRAYLFTLGQSAGRYGLHLEYPAAMTSMNLIDAYENLPLRSLVDILAVHFDIHEIRQLSQL